MRAFADLLRQAAEADPRVGRDAARLWRRWKKTGGPPKRWTVRWNRPATSLLEEAAGLDVLRRQPGGGRAVCLDLLTTKLGGPEPIRQGLESFLSPDQHGKAKAVFIRFLEELLAGVHSNAATRWLNRLLISEAVPARRGPRISADPATISFVGRALDVLDNLAGQFIHASDLGPRVGASSKTFRPGSPARRMLADALLYLKGRSEAADPAREEALEEAGVLLSPTAYAVLAAGPLAAGGPPLDFPWKLAQKDEAAMLTLQNLGQAGLLPEAKGVVTIENEAAFLTAMREGLHRRSLLVLTSGFPNRAVLTLLLAVNGQAGFWRHWGDTDLAGVRIARLLEGRLARTPELFRCAPADIRRFKDRLIPLSPGARAEMASDLKARPDALGADVLRTTLAEGGWLEQEAWEPPPDPLTKRQMASII